MNSRPGCRRPRRTTFAGSTGSTPASEPSTTRPSSVTSQRPGRSPLRSRQAPSTRPSEKTIAAGPSQGSITEEL